MDRLERFDILNNCLGYGRANSTIIHFSLSEEYGDWSINDLIKNNTKYDQFKNEIDYICTDEKLEVYEKTLKLNSLLSCNVIEILDDEVRKREDLQNHIDECEPNVHSRESPTQKFQFKVSKYAIQNMNKNVKFNEIDYGIFGTKYGNEICMNYIPSNLQS